MALLPDRVYTNSGWFDDLADSQSWYSKGLVTTSVPLAVLSAAATSTTNNASAYTSDSFTPTQGDLLVVVSGITATAVSPTCTTGSNGITFTRVVDQAWSASAHRHNIFVANQLVPASPTAMTVSIDVTGDNGTGGNISVLRVQGMQRTGTAAVRQATAFTNVVGTGGAYDMSFPAATLSSNIVIATLANNTNPATITPPTGFTEICDIGYDTPSAGLEVCYDLTGGYTTRTWGSISATVGTANGIELDTSAPPSLAYPDVVVGGVKKTVANAWIVVGGSKKSVVEMSVIVGGVKKPLP